MQARWMEAGKKYKLATGEVVVFSRPSENGERMIVHPIGEPDMQSCFGISPTDSVKPVNQIIPLGIRCSRCEKISKGRGTTRSRWPKGWTYPAHGLYFCPSCSEKASSKEERKKYQKYAATLQQYNQILFSEVHKLAMLYHERICGKAKAVVFEECDGMVCTSAGNALDATQAQ